MRHILALFWLLSAVAIGVGAGSAEAAPPALSVYGQLPAFERAAISASGNRIAMIGIFDEQRRLVVVDQDAKPVFALPLGAAKIRGLLLAGDDRVIVYKSDTVALDGVFSVSKTELFSAIVIPLNGTRKIWSVFEGHDRITGGVQGFYGANIRDGRWYGYFGGITRDRQSSSGPFLTSTKPVLYEVDLDTGVARAIGLRPGDGIFREWVVGRDGEVDATLDYVSQSGAWTIRNRAGDRIRTGSSRLGGADLIGLSNADNALIYRASDDESGATRWFEMPLAGGEAKEMLAAAGIERALFDNRSRRLIGYVTGGDVPAYRLLDARQQKIMNATTKAFPGYLVTLLDWNDSFDKLVVRTEGGDDPQSWWLVDIRTGQAKPLGQSYNIPAADVAPTKMVRYKAADGTEIAAVLTLPPGREAKNLPAIILPHGGPASHDWLGFDWWAQAFAARGYAVLQPNFRGSTGYGAAFHRAGDGEWGRKMQSDISDGLAHLAREGIADPKRACIMGASYGGYAALAGVTLQQGIYRCAVSVAGIGDVAKLAITERAESGGDPAMVRSLKQQIGSGRDLAAISPIRFVDKVTVPVLLIHGQDDTRVRYDQSSAMAAALRRAGKPVEFVTLPGEDHWLSKGATRLAMLQAAVSFVEKHNPSDALTPSSGGD